MIKALRDLFGTPSREQPAKKRAAVAAPKAQSTGGAYRAVSLAPSLMCCAAATQVRGKRVLLREAPQLPLKACSMAKDCKCKFLKNADRRDGDRRLFGAEETSRWFAGSENRKGVARRAMARGLILQD
jgi:hypothetical protein